MMIVVIIIKVMMKIVVMMVLMIIIKVTCSREELAAEGDRGAGADIRAAQRGEAWTGDTKYGTRPNAI